jgi:hypothetical protein
MVASFARVSSVQSNVKTTGSGRPTQASGIANIGPICILKKKVQQSGFGSVGH